MNINVSGKNSIYLVLSDIHGNLSALEQVFKAELKKDISGIILLGDLIDYGMRSNEVIDFIENKVNVPIIVNIWGNHEDVVLNGHFERLSSDRGRRSALFTKEELTDSTKRYLDTIESRGKCEFDIGLRKCLAVHGSLEDYIWKSIEPGKQSEDYAPYDFVLSGHSHRPHYFACYYHTQNCVMRNQKATIFINPGSVGQPRNGNPRAQYATVDFISQEVSLKAVEYDIKYEQSLYDERMDPFYRDRLERGI